MELDHLLVEHTEIMGQLISAKKQLSKHAFAYNMAMTPVMDALATINQEKTNFDDFVILPVYLTEIL